MATTLRFLDNSEPHSYEAADAVGTHKLSIAVVDPDEESRCAMIDSVFGPLTGSVREIIGYSPGIEEAHWLTSQGFDVVVIGLDRDLELALGTIESVCELSSATVMVYSRQTDREPLVRSMRAGAREFFTLPLEPDAVQGALLRAASRSQVAQARETAAGKLFVFLGAKGGSGTTTIAGNFAVSVAALTGKKTLLIDLDLPLGDAALELGITGEFSTLDALRDAGRLDSSLLSRLVTRHDSGLSVLAAPGKFQHFNVKPTDVNKLLNVSARAFDFVVVDPGSRFDLSETRLFEMASGIYLVSQLGIPELRNANRLIANWLAPHSDKLQLVLNRISAKEKGFSEEAIEKALTRKPHWRIPSDYHAVRKTQDHAKPLSSGNSPIGRIIREMARVACQLPADQSK